MPEPEDDDPVFTSFGTIRGLVGEGGLPSTSGPRRIKVCDYRGTRILRYTATVGSTWQYFTFPDGPEAYDWKLHKVIWYHSVAVQYGICRGTAAITTGFQFDDSFILFGAGIAGGFIDDLQWPFKRGETIGCFANAIGAQLFIFMRSTPKFLEKSRLIEPDD